MIDCFYSAYIKKIHHGLCISKLYGVKREFILSIKKFNKFYIKIKIQK
ncbi:hypothetical protein HMPREF1123_01179 [Clostridioides difficile 050-P50-2011]|nr:hypothetical protein HMPREF1122_01570 [Clostridioides difficile 002-P50-2011]EHJ31356.1 hypothetical protein HMPREF1123_01179 [Clostridioides difficile 050-P50-2011]